MTLPQSDHYNGKRFFNPGDGSGRGLFDLLRWKLTSRPKLWPERVEVVRRPLPPAPEPDGVVATWVGQSTFLLRSSSCTILTDPIFSERAAPVGWAGPRRAARPGLDFDSVPGVDLVLLSHDHYDHCDLPSLRWIARRDAPLVISPLGHRSLLEGAGLSRIIELDWWQTHICGPGMEATLVPARHWSRRRPFGTNSRLWGGFMLKAGGRLVYFAGDSGYGEGLFEAIAERCGAPDLSLIPIGAYEPRWFMAPAHMNPAEAVRVHCAVRSRRSVAMHWGTFQLTDEGRDEPVLALREALRMQGINPGDFNVLELGESAAV